MGKEIELESGKYYHIYNHANGGDNIFITENNYDYFLKKYKEYISPFADTFSYCLMPNHFHLLIKIGEPADLHLTGFKNLSGVISRQFSNFFNSYSKALNKQEGRMGSLFNRPFKRNQITSEEQLRNTVLYIHANHVHHGFCENIHEWKHSSYHSLISDKATLLKRKEVTEWFEDTSNFIYCHQYRNEKLLEKVAAELEA